MSDTLRDTHLSAMAQTVWAKTRTDARQSFALTGWLPLYQHLDDAAAVAGKLWDDWAAQSIRETVAQAVGSTDAARELVVWLSGIHDVGKASPAFAVQVPALADEMRAAGLACDPSIKDGDERRQVRHELVSYLAVQDWLAREHAFDRESAMAIASVAAAHHGRPADTVAVRSARNKPHLVGEGAWDSVRRELLAAADTAFTTADGYKHWRGARLQQPVLVLISGLVIMADWIASSDLFDAAQLGAPASSSTRDRLDVAWRELDFPRRWQPHSEDTDAAYLLASRFSLPKGSVPHATQRALVETAQAIDQPELLMLESEMGSGKTEAALLAAEILASRFGMSGVFVGLPTQATADGMFSRVLAWADHLGLNTPSSVYLARSRPSLNPEYSTMAREAHFRSIGDRYDSWHEASSTSLVIAHRWFSDPRRGPLSNFVVGTIDQALFAGLRSRYVMLRHLALASKVVIIDEVHAYDVYMQEYFLRVLEWLGAYGVPVVLLSATLPSGRRRQFIEAYDRGRRAMSARASDIFETDDDLTWGERRARRAQANAESSKAYSALDGRIGYPVISRSSTTGPAVVVTPPGNGGDRVVSVVRQDDSTSELIDLLRSALREGGCAAVIRNTVRRAQETVAAIRDALAGPEVEVILAHSRYLGVDRAAKDRLLLDKFGRGGERPKKTSIVVATQVIEQSLDIDFDLIVTDIAPVDLLLQRSGRLHRHAERDRPGPLREARLVVVAESWSDTPPSFDAGSTVVYAEAVLLRTAAALNGMDTVAGCAAVRLPADIEPLVETVYGDDDSFVPVEWRPQLMALERELSERQAKQRQAADSYRLGAVSDGRRTLIGWVSGPDVDPELTPPGRATVRDTDETLEVIVLQRDDTGAFFVPRWVGPGAGTPIPLTEPPKSWLARIILGCMLRLPAGMCRGNALDRHIATLECAFDLPAWHTSPLLKGELVLALDMDGRGSLNEFDLSYSRDDGLTFARRST